METDIVYFYDAGGASSLHQFSFFTICFDRSFRRLGLVDRFYRFALIPEKENILSLSFVSSKCVSTGNDLHRFCDLFLHRYSLKERGQEKGKLRVSGVMRWHGRVHTNEKMDLGGSRMPLPNIAELERVLLNGDHYSSIS